MMLTRKTVLKHCPSMARRSIFVDPVVFCLWEGGELKACLFRFLLNLSRRLSFFLLPYAYECELVSRAGSDLLTTIQALELLLYYFIATEIGTAHYIQRVSGCGFIKTS